jgi:hypothetical protein
MLRLASNRVTGKFSNRNLKSAAERRFSSKPPFSPPINMIPKAKGGGDGVATSVAALVAIMLVTAAPVVYVKMEKIQLDPRIENIIGTIVGTHAVLFLRPDGHQKDLSPSLYKSVTEIDGFNDNSDVSGEQSTSDSINIADETLEQVAGQKSAVSASNAISSKSTSVSSKAVTEAAAGGKKVAGKESSNAEKGDGKVESKSDEELVCPMPAKKVPIEEAVCPMPPKNSGATTATTTAGAATTTSAAGASATSSVAAATPSATTGATATAGAGAASGSRPTATGSSATCTTAASTAAVAATVASGTTVAAAGSGSSSVAPTATSKSSASPTTSTASSPLAPRTASASTSTLAAEKAGKAGTMVTQT